MKNILLYMVLLAAVMSPAVAEAQYSIPNGSFERWTGINQPADWTVVQGKPTEGNLVNYTFVDSVGDTTDYTRYAFDGDSFIEMPMLDTTTPSIISQKFAMTGRPKYFSMSYAYFPETKENQFQVGFFFTRWNTFTNQEDTILAGEYNSVEGKLSPPWSYILKADLSQLYNPNTAVTPDSATIVINSSLQSSPYLKTLFVIDKIYFTDTLVSAGIKVPENNLFAANLSTYPNPFSYQTTIFYNLAQSGTVSLNVFDMEGRQVAALVNGNQGGGPHTVVFNANTLPEGVYFYRLQSDNDVETGKLVKKE